MQQNKLLLIKISDDFLDSQIIFLKDFCDLMSLEFNYVDIKFEDDLIYALNNKCTRSYNYIYIVGHSNQDKVGSESLSFTWIKLAKLLSSAECVSNNCKLFLKSCLSSTKPVINTLFENCKKITNIVGFRDEVVGIDGYMAIILFIYYTEMNNLNYTDAIVNIKKFIPTQIECFYKLDQL